MPSRAELEQIVPPYPGEPTTAWLGRLSAAGYPVRWHPPRVGVLGLARRTTDKIRSRRSR